MKRSRQVLALVLLGVFIYINAGLLPSFIANLRLQRFVEALTQSAGADTQGPDWVRAQVLERARQLSLPVQAADVQVESGPKSMHVRVRYVVPVNLPGYTVKLHFSPSAGR